MTTHAQRVVEAQVDVLIPKCLWWSPEQVADWIESIGFPMYRECFTRNFISGRRLLKIDASQLPRIGVIDFKDIRVISAAIRELLQQMEEPNYHKSISRPRRDPMGTFLELKTYTGKNADQLTYSKFIKSNRKYLERVYGDDAPTIPKA